MRYWIIPMIHKNTCSSIPTYRRNFEHTDLSFKPSDARRMIGIGANNEKGLLPVVGHHTDTMLMEDDMTTNRVTEDSNQY